MHNMSRQINVKLFWSLYFYLYFDISLIIIWWLQWCVSSSLAAFSSSQHWRLWKVELELNQTLNNLFKRSFFYWCSESQKQFHNNSRLKVISIIILFTGAALTSCTITSAALRRKQHLNLIGRSGMRWSVCLAPGQQYFGVCVMMNTFILALFLQELRASVEFKGTVR